MDLHYILDKLDNEEKVELARLLHRELNVPDLDLVSSEVGRDRPVCPHCEGVKIYAHGHYKERRRYKCRSCSKTFNDFTGTAVDGIKKLGQFQEYLLMVVDSVTIRKAANKIGVNMKTIFDWRHKLLSSLEALNGTGFSKGIVECDDKQFDINEKGSRGLGRKAYKRPSDRNTKRGVSNDKVSIMVATDRKGGSTMRMAKVGRIDAESVRKTIGGLVAHDNVLCSDSHPSIIKWAKENDLEHHTFVAARQHVKDRCYHVQHVNSMDNRYERWIKGFYGVSTKYLPGYLNWFVFLQKIRESTLQARELAKCVAENIGAIKTYGMIEQKYEELMIPQLSKT